MHNTFTKSSNLSILRHVFASGLVAVLALLLSSCQPTPESETVIQTGDFLEALQETEFTPYEAPEHVKESKTESGLTIAFDAQVLVPEASAYSIVELERVQYTRNDYLRLMDLFMPEGEWINSLPKTKAWWTERYYIVKTSERFSEAEKKANEEYTPGNIEDAPETVEETPFDLDAAVESGNGIAWCKQSNGSYATFAMNTQTGSWSYERNESEYAVFESSLQPESTESDAFLLPDFERTFEFSEADALAEAQQLLAKLGLSDSFALYSSEKAITYALERIPLSYGWYFIFTRVNNGLQVPYDFSSWNTWQGSPAPAYAAPWDREMVAVFVDANGVFSCNVRGLAKQTQVLYENVALLPFDALLERIEKQMVYQHAFQQDGVTDQAVKINSIALRLAVINIKDKSGYGMLIPSWWVDYVSSYTQNGVENQFHNTTIFNAIDGSYIEPRAMAEMLGYQ